MNTVVGGLTRRRWLAGATSLPLSTSACAGGAPSTGASLALAAAEGGLRFGAAASWAGLGNDAPPPRDLRPRMRLADPGTGHEVGGRRTVGRYSQPASHGQFGRLGAGHAQVRSRTYAPVASKRPAVGGRSHGAGPGLASGAQPFRIADASIRGRGHAMGRRQRADRNRAAPGWPAPERFPGGVRPGLYTPGAARGAPVVAAGRAVSERVRTGLRPPRRLGPPLSFSSSCWSGCARLARP